MREILFRGKRVDNGEWIEGSLVIGNNYNFIITDEDYQDVVASQSTLVCSSHPIEKDNKTIGQYTGLTDKNGKKIFESDIVRITTGIKGYESTYHSAIQKVRYETDECGIALFYPFDNSDMVEVEVIGNIYDNPELLGVGV